MRKAAIAVALAVLVGTVVVAAAVANTSGSAAASQLASLHERLARRERTAHGTRRLPRDRSS